VKQTTGISGCSLGLPYCHLFSGHSSQTATREVILSEITHLYQGGSNRYYSWETVNVYILV